MPITAEHREALLRVLRGIDQCQAHAETLLADPVEPDVFVRAEEMREFLADMHAKVMRHLEK